MTSESEGGDDRGVDGSKLPMYRIYLVEDHALMREMLLEFLSLEPDLLVCGTASSGETALQEIKTGEIDLVLVDTSLPAMSGIDLVRHLLGRRPDLRCLMFSGHGESSYVEQAMDAGARGYVLKGSPDELTVAIRRVLDGGVYVSTRFRRAGGE